MKTLSENRIPSPDNYRKVSKPLIEKKRRARINASLNELKGLLETVLGAEIPRDSKLEKADILELAVKHLRRVHKQIVNGSPVGQYRSGYGECASETSRYLGAVHGLDTKLRTRLMNHLASTVNQNTYNNQNVNLMTSQAEYKKRVRQSLSANKQMIHPTNNYVTLRQPIRDVNGNYVINNGPITNENTSYQLISNSPSHPTIKSEPGVWRPW